MLMQAPKGTRDVLPSEVYKWQYLENIFYDICRKYNYKEIRFPVFEYTELFQRGVGNTTDIVQKEMYTFFDKGGRSITLRPEGVMTKDLAGLSEAENKKIVNTEDFLREVRKRLII
jgi:histidyl-tRNA synthetase